MLVLIEKASGKTMEQIADEHGWDLAENHFSDTDNPAVTFLKYAGIANGVGDNRYDPGGAYTRAQIVTMTGRVAEKFFGIDAQGENPFDDVPDYAAPYVGYAAENGIVQGIDGMFEPDRVLQNQSTAILSYRTYEVWK